jgi:GNAT superfamily N-acetyltransferase
VSAYVVRDANDRDARGIAHVHTRTWQVAYAHLFPEESLAGLDEERRTQRWHNRLSAPEPRQRTLVAEREGSIVGFASMGPTQDPQLDPGLVGELYAIYVLPETWGEGVGQALMGEVLSRLRTDGFPEAILWVLEDNPRTRRYYELAGWRTDGATKEEPVLGIPAQEVRYRIALHPTG